MKLRGYGGRGGDMGVEGAIRFLMDGRSEGKRLIGGFHGAGGLILLCS